MKIERSVFLCAFFVVGMLTVEGESFGNLIPYGKKILYKRKLKNCAASCCECGGKPSIKSNGNHDEVWTKDDAAKRIT